MDAAPLTLRTLTEPYLDEFVRVVEESYLYDPTPDDLARYRALAEPDRYSVLFDGDRVVGGGGVLTRELTLPGAGPVPVAAVTAVGIAPDARRRGGLNAVMAAQFAALHDGGEP